MIVFLNLIQLPVGFV